MNPVPVCPMMAWEVCPALGCHLSHPRVHLVRRPCGSLLRLLPLWKMMMIRGGAVGEGSPSLHLFHQEGCCFHPWRTKGRSRWKRNMLVACQNKSYSVWGATGAAALPVEGVSRVVGSLIHHPGLFLLGSWTAGRLAGDKPWPGPAAPPAGMVDAVGFACHCCFLFFHRWASRAPAAYLGSWGGCMKSTKGLPCISPLVTLPLSWYSRQRNFLRSPFDLHAALPQMIAHGDVGPS